MKTWLVGGAVRDGLLGIPFNERDWVVVGATEQGMLDAGFTRADPDAAFPVFLHPETGEEYALARRETKSGAGYKGFTIEAGPDVTLEQDLARRDLTINAMAQGEDGELVDPYGGREDLDAGLLRHVTAAFIEDPVRLLRIARFAAKLGVHGFRVAHGTHALMKRMADDPDLQALRPQRVWQEWRRALAEPQPWRFVEVLQRCGALARVVPELAGLLDQDPGHAGRGEVPALAAQQRAVAANLSAPWRLAVLLATAPGDIEALLTRLKVDRAHAQPVRLLRRLAPAHAALADAPASDWLGFIEQAGGLKPGAAFDELLAACAALQPDLAAALHGRLLHARDAAGAVDPRALAADGLAGPALGAALRDARVAAIAALPGDA